MRHSIAVLLAATAPIAAVPSQAAEVSLQPYANANVSTYTSGEDYPSGSTTIGGIGFSLASFEGGTGIVQLGGARSSTITIDLTGVNTAYVIVNSAVGVFGATNGSLEFVGGASGSSSSTYFLVQGLNIRDHYDGDYNNISSGVFATADYPGGNRFDVYRYDLTALGGTVDSLIFTSFDQFSTSPIAGDPFLAGLTLTNEVAGVPEPASWAMMIGGFAMVGGAMRARRRVRVGYAAA